MPPKKLGNDFKTIKISCKLGHEIARYRKPRVEWGERTHKLWLVQERLAKLVTVPPIIGEEPDELLVPETDTSVYCGETGCSLEIGKIAMVGGTVAIKLNEQNLRPTKG